MALGRGLSAVSLSVSGSVSGYLNMVTDVLFLIIEATGSHRRTLSILSDIDKFKWPRYRNRQSDVRCADIIIFD